MSIAPPKCRVEIFRGPPHVFDDHFNKYPWQTWDADVVKDGDIISLTIQAGKSQGGASYSQFGTINTNPWRYIIVRCTELSGAGAYWQISVLLSGTPKVSQSFTTTGLKTLDLYALNGNVHFDFNDIRILVYDSQGDKVSIDYIAVCKDLLLVPVDTSDIVETLTITRPILARGISGANFTIPNFEGTYNNAINKNDVIIIWLTRTEADLGKPSTKEFGGRIVKISNRAERYGSFFIDLDCHGHAFELNIPPALFHKYYSAVNGRIIIEDALAVCNYLARHPADSQWFDAGGSSGLTDDRIDSTHDLEYNEVIPSTPILEISLKAKNPAGVKGFDICEMPSGVLIGHLKNSEDFKDPLGAGVGVTPEAYVKGEDIYPLRSGPIKVYGIMGKGTLPPSKDMCESLDGWTCITGFMALDSSIKKVGNYSIKAWNSGTPSKTEIKRTTGPYEHVSGEAKTTPISAEYVEFSIYPSESCTIKIELYAPDSSNKFQKNLGTITGDTWTDKKLKLGPDGDFPDKVGNPQWKNIKAVYFYSEWSGDFHEVYYDGLHFSGSRCSGEASETSVYGKRIPEPEVDDSLQTNAECQARAEGLLAFLKDPIITLSDVVVDGDHRYKPGDKQRILVPNDNLDAYFRIVEVRHEVKGPTWDANLTLSNEPHEIDYVFRLLKEAQKLLERKS